MVFCYFKERGWQRFSLQLHKPPRVGKLWHSGEIASSTAKRKTRENAETLGKKSSAWDRHHDVPHDESFRKRVCRDLDEPKFLSNNVGVDLQGKFVVSPHRSCDEKRQIQT